MRITNSVLIWLVWCAVVLVARCHCSQSWVFCTHGGPRNQISSDQCSATLKLGNLKLRSVSFSPAFVAALLVILNFFLGCFFNDFFLKLAGCFHSSTTLP